MPGRSTFIRDLSDKQRAEQRIEELRSGLIHAARVSAMGTMASTLAHELNQPITAVVNYVRGIANLIDANDPDDLPMIREALDDTAQEALRAGTIVRRLREFVARGEVEKSVEHIPDLVDEACKLALIGAREKGGEIRVRHLAARLDNLVRERDRRVGARIVGVAAAVRGYFRRI